MGRDSGEEVAVVVDIAECRCRRNCEHDFKQFLRSAPDSELFEIGRPMASAQLVDLGEDE